MSDTFNAATTGIAAALSQGAILYISATAPGSASYYPLQGLKKIDAPNFKSKVIDNTDLSSTAGKSFKGLPIPEAISGEYFSSYDSNVSPLIEGNVAAYGSGTSALLYFVLKLPSLNTPRMYTFSGYFTAYQPVTAAVDTEMMGTFTIQPVGTITEAVES